MLDEFESNVVPMTTLLLESKEEPPEVPILVNPEPSPTNAVAEIVPEV